MGFSVRHVASTKYILLLLLLLQSPATLKNEKK